MGRLRLFHVVRYVSIPAPDAEAPPCWRFTPGRLSGVPRPVAIEGERNVNIRAQRASRRIPIVKAIRTCHGNPRSHLEELRLNALESCDGRPAVGIDKGEDVDCRGHLMVSRAMTRPHRVYSLETGSLQRHH